MVDVLVAGKPIERDPSLLAILHDVAFVVAQRSVVIFPDITVALSAVKEVMVGWPAIGAVMVKLLLLAITEPSVDERVTM